MELTIDSQSFDVPGAWEHNTSIARLLVNARGRGESITMPYVPGRVAYPVRRDEIIVDLELEVYGDVDHAGAPHADEYVGLADNLLFLQDFANDRMEGTATYPAVLTVGTRTFEADVQILNMLLMQHRITAAYVSYDLRIPAGRWTEVA